MRGVISVNDDLKALMNLMIDYNLTWTGVYEIVKEAIEENVEEE